MTNEITSFAVFGERGSGTSWLNELMIKNSLRGMSLTNSPFTGWKHGLWTPHQTRCLNKNFLVVVIQKDIYTWLNSFYKAPYHMDYAKKLTLSEFIHTEYFSQASWGYFQKWGMAWTDEVKERPDGNRWPNPIRLWMDKYHAWESIPKGISPIVYISYEALAIDPWHHLRMMEKFGLTLDPNQTERETMEQRNRAIKKLHEAQKACMESFTSDDLKFIRGELEKPRTLFY